MNEKNSDAPNIPGASASEGSAVPADEAIESSGCHKDDAPLAFGQLASESLAVGVAATAHGYISELEELRELARSVETAQQALNELQLPAAEFADSYSAGMKLCAHIGWIKQEIESLRERLAPGDHTGLLKRITHVRPDLVTDLESLSFSELIRRCLVQADWIGAFSASLDGLNLRIDGKLIDGSGVDKCRMPRDIRHIVERLLKFIELKDELLEETTIEKERLYGLINSPQIADFIEAIKLEAIHQRERWGSDHDAGKTDVDWLFLAGYLGGKAVEAGKEAEVIASRDPRQHLIDKLHERRLHHIVAAGAAVLNWHAQRIGVEISATRMRPGIMPPIGESSVDELREEGPKLGVDVGESPIETARRGMMTREEVNGDQS